MKTPPLQIRDVYSPDSNDSGIDADHSMTSRRYRHVTNPEPETAEQSDEKSAPQEQVGVTEASVTNNIRQDVCGDTRDLRREKEGEDIQGGTENPHRRIVTEKAERVSGFDLCCAA